MATIIIDFDSTLISIESLEIILESHVESLDSIRELSKQAMEGKIPFSTSLEKRLELAHPNLEDIQTFSKKVHTYLTPGMEVFIKEMNSAGHSIWIISGAIRDVILPLAPILNIPESHIHGVTLLFGKHGKYLGIDKSNNFWQSKVQGVVPLLPKWSHPRVMIGDGMTDYDLYKHSLVDRFILFTQHMKRDAVMQQSPEVAEDVNKLRELLENL